MECNSIITRWFWIEPGSIEYTHGLPAQVTYRRLNAA